ncbi:hypothetical protein WN48_00115 [Eufriesea mexicana]|nr:hypothetical protein WN48_00115 [Eufriesea mexicana]
MLQQGGGTKRSDKEEWRGDDIAVGELLARDAVVPLLEGESKLQAYLKRRLPYQTSALTRIPWNIRRKFSVFSETVEAERVLLATTNERANKQTTGISSLSYNGYSGALSSGALSSAGLSSNAEALPVETVPEGPETMADGAGAAATTTLLKGASAIAIVAAGEMKLTLADAEAAALTDSLVSVLELDAELSTLVDSAVSANRRVTRQSGVHFYNSATVPVTGPDPLLGRSAINVVETDTLATALEAALTEAAAALAATVTGSVVVASTLAGSGGAVGPAMIMGPVEGPITAFADAIPIVSLIAVAFADASVVDDSSALSIATAAFADAATAPFFVSASADAALLVSAMATELSDGATSVTAPAVAPLMSTESSRAPGASVVSGKKEDEETQNISSPSSKLSKPARRITRQPLARDELLCVADGAVRATPGDTMVTGPEDDPSTIVVPVTGPATTVCASFTGSRNDRSWLTNSEFNRERLKRQSEAVTGRRSTTGAPLEVPITAADPAAGPINASVPAPDPTEVKGPVAGPNKLLVADSGASGPETASLGSTLP